MLLSSSNRKYPPFPLFSYFSVAMCLRSSANSRIRFGLQIVFVCLCSTLSHYHHCANFIWRLWTYKIPVRYNLSSVWVRLSIFSQLSNLQYVGLCVFSLPISFAMIERIYIPCLIIIIKSEVGTITHCLGLGHEQWYALHVFLYSYAWCWPGSWHHRAIMEYGINFIPYTYHWQTTPRIPRASTLLCNQIVFT